MGKKKKGGKKKGGEGKAEQEEEAQSVPSAAQPSEAVPKPEKPPIAEAAELAPKPRKPPPTEAPAPAPGPYGDTPRAAAAPRQPEPKLASPEPRGMAGDAGAALGAIPKGRGRGRGRGRGQPVLFPGEKEKSPEAVGVSFGPPPGFRSQVQQPQAVIPPQPQAAIPPQPQAAFPPQPQAAFLPQPQAAIPPQTKAAIPPPVQSAAPIPSPTQPPPSEHVAAAPKEKQPKKKQQPKAKEPSAMPSMESLAKALPDAPSTLRPPPRKDFGKRGRQIKLRANHFEVTFNSKLIIHHYDVEIVSEKDCPKALKRKLIDKVMKENEKIFSKYGCVFDGEKNLYACAELPIPSHRTTTFDVELEDAKRTRKFAIAVKRAAVVYLSELQEFLNNQKGEIKSCQTAIQAFDIAMRHFASLKFITIGRSIFPNTRGLRDLGEGVELWRGYYQSVRPQWKTLHLNFDVSNRGFVKSQSALNLLCELLQIYPENLAGYQMQYRDKDMFLKVIKGLKVEVTHTPIKRSYKIMALSDKSASLQTFPLQSDDGKTSRDCTVAKYFLEQYKMKLRFPNLPCLHAQPLDKHRYLPLEVCHIPEGQQAKKLNDRQTTEMIRGAARPAPDRRRDIEQLMRNVNFTTDPFLKSFGLSVSDKMVPVNGRVLPAPEIEMSDRVLTKDGVWDMRNRKVFNAADINPWGLIMCVDDKRFGHQDVEKFIQSMMVTGRSMGFNIQPLVFKEYFRGRDPEIQNLFRAIKKDYPKIKLVVVILPGKTSIYAEVKRMGDTAIGVATQCIMLKNAQQTKPQTISNIFLKINAKLGGINNIVNVGVPSPGFAQVMKVPVLVLGADVTHPPAGDKTKPSIAAIIGSFDKYAAKYMAKVRVQEHRMEIIVELKEVIMDLLRKFRAETGYIPQKIIFYRDGVGEGQFYQVLKHELQAIRAACSALSATYKPGITFLVVQKRHHTRLFCEDSRDTCGRAQNVPPGTTVDTTIIHPVENDFYLCSHYGIQGTSRPTHYHILWDDNNYDADVLQTFTYELCHVYARCTRSVSIPAPAYYAHHAAFRARHHLEELQRQCDREGGGDSKSWLERMQKAVETHASLGTMYFT